MKKIILAMLNVVIMLIGTVASAEYTDVDSSIWYSRYIAEAEKLNIMCGYEDGTFRPENKITNAELIKIAVEFSGGSINDSGDWKENYMNYAKEYKYIIDGEMSDYDAPVTRQNIARVISRILQLKETDTYSVSQHITDWDTTCPKCKKDIANCYANEIMSGYPDGTFRGRYPATRAEAATIIINAVNYRNSEVMDYE